MISSPFVRTLQTAAYFHTGIGCPNPKLLLNNNIVVKLGKSSGKVFLKDGGVLATHGEKNTLKDWMDSNTLSLHDDVG